MVKKSGSRFWSVPVGLLLAVAACADEGPIAPVDTGSAGATEFLSCSVDVRNGELGCSAPGASLGEGAYAAVIGGQGVYVELISNNVGYDETDEVFRAEVRVRNMTNQVLGSSDGSTLDAAGIRVFFVDAPVTSGGSGAVTVKNASGTDQFTKAGQSYFTYSQALSPGQTSTALTWEWDVPATVTKFDFLVGVEAAVQNAFAIESGIQILGKTLSADTQHTCVLTIAGQAYCWGRGSYGKLGFGAALAENLPVPQKVDQGTLRFVSITGGLHHNCAIDIEGDAYCWGNQDAGRLGNGELGAGNVTTPQPVVGGHKWVQLVTGRRFTCGLTVDGDTYCWGANATNYSPLGDGQPGVNRAEPHPVVGGHKFVTLGAGKYHVCGVTTAGDAYCWGSGSNGRLGTGDTLGTVEPTPVVGGHKFAKVYAGNAHTCALTVDGEAWCWGSGSNHKLGVLVEDPDGPDPVPLTGNNLEPYKVTTDVKFVELVLGQYHTCGLAQDGKAWCWGSGTGGKVGNGVTSSGNVSTPVEVLGGHRFVDIVAGLEHTCGKTANDEVYCWGRGGWGQLGHGDFTDQGVPVKVMLNLTS